MSLTVADGYSGACAIMTLTVHSVGQWMRATSTSPFRMTASRNSDSLGAGDPITGPRGAERATVCPALIGGTSYGER
jgi:hypothetical protein